MNIRNINLNLLIALDALLTEKHVTRAAKKVFITQSAMSNSLNQLREIFKDQLLVRTSKGMTPTAKGLKLQPKIREVLENIESVITDEPCFDPAKSHRIFKIGISDFAEFCLLPNVLKKLSALAPNIQLELIHMNHVTSEVPFLNGEIELAVGSILENNIGLEEYSLLQLNAVVIARKGHPLFKKKITLTDFLSAKHLRVQYHNNQTLTRTDIALSELGKTRDVIASFPHILPMLFLVAESDYIASIPNLVTKDLAKKLGLCVQPLPFELKAHYLKLVWHSTHENDPGHKWLRELIRDVEKEVKLEKYLS